MVELAFFKPKVEHTDNESQKVEQTERTENRGKIDATNKAEKNDCPEDTEKGNKGRLQSAFKRKGEAVKQKLEELKKKHDEKKQVKEGQDVKSGKNEKQEDVNKNKKPENDVDSRENKTGRAEHTNKNIRDDGKKTESKERDDMKHRNQILETPEKADKKWYDDLSTDDKIGAGEKGKFAAQYDIIDAQGYNDDFKRIKSESKGKKRKEQFQELRNTNNHVIQRLERRLEPLEAGIKGVEEKLKGNFSTDNSEYKKKLDEFKVEYASVLKHIADLENNNKEIDQEIGSETSEKNSNNGEKKSVKDRISDFLGRH